MLIAFASFKDKITVYKHTKNLKGVKNENNVEYYVNDQLPSEIMETKRKIKQKIKINKGLIDAQQQSVEIKRGELHIDLSVFNLKVKELTCANILEMDANTLKRALSFKLFKGADLEKNDSKFFAYTAKAHTISQVLDRYRQIKYRFLDATHMMCAYRLLDPDVAHMTDSIDGGELGAGRRLVEYLIENSCENTVVFVIRMHCGPKLGPVHFDMIVNAAKSVVEKMPDDLSYRIEAMNSQNPSGLFSLHRQHDVASLAYLHRGQGGTAAARSLDLSSTGRHSSIRKNQQKWSASQRITSAEV